MYEVGDYTCPTDCDADCEAECHECHQPNFKRLHDVSSCIATQRLHRNPAYIKSLNEADAAGACCCPDCFDCPVHGDVGMS